MATAPARTNQQNTSLSKRDVAFKDLNSMLQSPGMKHKLQLALPKHLTPDRMIRIALSAASRQPLLLECTPESIALSLVRAAEFGVETDGWDAHLVPYKNKGRLECQLIVDYKGLCKLAYQSELVLELVAGAVCERDLFEYEYGSQSFLRHVPTNEEDPGKLVYAWAMAKIKGGGSPFVVLNRRQVMEHKKASTASASDYSPWNKPATEPSMWKKTAVRELAKMIPRSAILHAALKHEDAADAGGQVIDGVVFGADEEQGSKSDEVAGRLGAAGTGDAQGNGKTEPTTEPKQSAEFDWAPFQDLINNLDMTLEEATSKASTMAVNNACDTALERELPQEVVGKIAEMRRIAVTAIKKGRSEGSNTK